MKQASEVFSGDHRAMARAITAVENGTPEGRALLEEIAPKLGAARRIGVTGPPGVGKSTTVDAITRVIREGGEKVGVIAVDPTSPFTGGALLGDRIRMNRMADDAGVFMRSMATRGAAGGLSRATQDAADILDASGCGTVIIETVGVGQSEVEIARAADVVLVLLSPESGDGIQAMKSGLMEIADIIVINKADRPGADKIEHEIRAAMELGLKSRRDTPIHLTEAFRGKGIPELVARFDAFLADRKKDGRFEERRRENMKRRLRTIAEFMVHRSLWESDGAAERLARLAEAVLNRTRSSYAAAEELVSEALGT
jgi:LAO/AO transport system kinase